MSRFLLSDGVVHDIVLILARLAGYIYGGR